MADVPGYAQVAAALDPARGYAAVLATPPSAPVVRARTGAPAPAGSGIGHDVVGVAEAGTADAPREVIAYHVPDPAAARAAVERVWRDGTSSASAQPIAKLARVESVRVADGCVVVEITPLVPGAARQMLTRADTPSRSSGPGAARPAAEALTTSGRARRPASTGRLDVRRAGYSPRNFLTSRPCSSMSLRNVSFISSG